MKTKKQILSFLLAIAMIVPSILSIVHAESIEPNTNTAEDSYVSEQTIENTELLPQSGEESISSPGIIGEDVTKRDAFSKHYLRTDGTYIAITGAEAIHYQTDSGSWEEIDNSLILDSSSGYYENANSGSGFDIAFSNDASKEEAVMIKDGENSISWYIEALRPNGSKNNASKSAKVKVKNNNANANARINGKGGKENSSITYSNIFGTDTGATLRYSVSENRIEEDIIFERVPEISAYTMNIKAPGMEATLNADGSVEIIAKNGKAAYTVKAPIMYDSNGVYSADTLDTVNVYTPASVNDVELQKENIEQLSKRERNKRIITNAKVDQASGNYYLDDFSVKHLKKGTKLYRVCDESGAKGAWLTDWNSLSTAENDYTTILNGLQIDPEYNRSRNRKYIGVFELNQDVYVAYGEVRANTQFGAGGYTQYYIINFIEVLDFIIKYEMKGCP